MTPESKLAWECPTCRRTLRTIDGELRCEADHAFRSDRGLPVLCEADNYASSFGKEWTAHSRTQLDSVNGTTISRERFFDYTRWPTNMSGERVLEAGSGAGRFTEVLLSTGASVVSFDYSAAVFANAANNGSNPRLTLFRGDIFNIPFGAGTFDRVVCIGVLQHTPDPERAFHSLVRVLRPGGQLAVDIYRLAAVSLLHPKYYLRPLRHLISEDSLFDVVKRVVPALLPIKAAVRRLPLIGVPLAHALIPVPDYRGRLPLTDAQAETWSELDLFDMLSPAHDHPATKGTVLRWCKDARLEDVSIEVVSKGWQLAIRGRAPRAG